MTGATIRIILAHIRVVKIGDIGRGLRSCLLIREAFSGSHLNVDQRRLPAV